MKTSRFFTSLLLSLTLLTTGLVLISPPRSVAVVVDGSIQDPVTGVVEPEYVHQGIRYSIDALSGKFAGYLYMAEDAANYYFAFAQNVDINDNTYGDNSIGWPDFDNHTLDDLLNSEHLKVKLYDSDGNPNPILDFALDYATLDDVTGQVRCLGVEAGGDNYVVAGDPSWITAASSSLVWNFNSASPFFPDRMNTNPERITSNTYDSGTSANPDFPWIYEIVYEWSVSKSAFTDGILGRIDIAEVHNSPMKTGLFNPVPVPVLSLKKESNPPCSEQMAAGSAITYTISIENVSTLPLTLPPADQRCC